MKRQAARRRSLRRLMVQFTVAFIVVALASTIVVATLSASIRRTMALEADQLTIEQHTANLIVSSSYEQQLSAYRYIAAPSAEARHEFYARGNIAYQRIRRYLFRPMPLAARRKIETIKEAHESFEVAAQRAFDFGAMGDRSSQRRQILTLTEDAATLEHAVREFIAEREEQLLEVRLAHESELAALQREMVLLGALLGILVALMAFFLRRRVMTPISDLSIAVHALSEGSGLVRVAPQRYSEFQLLADSFDHMADRIRESRDEVQSRNVQLERMVHQLEHAQRELLQHEKLSAMGEMLAGLAHELNNPLAGILGIAQVLDGDLRESTDERLRGTATVLVDQLITESLRTRDLVRNLLNFSRDAETDLVAVHLPEAIDVAVGLRRHAYTQLGKRIIIETADDCYALAQQQKLELAIINIANNALDAMTECPGDLLRIRTTRRGDDVLVAFEDSGPGFAHPERAFDPFYTTKAVGAGTGLGQSLVHRFMNDFGGAVSAENTMHGGACVTLRLRIASAPAPIAAVPIPRNPDVACVPTEAPVRRRVLVVDDEKAIRFVQSRLLSRLDVDIDTASNGEEACSALMHSSYDLVITDLRMPGKVSGRDLLEWIARERPELAGRVVVVTGDTMSSIEGDALLPPPERVLTKPFDATTFLDCVRQVLRAVREDELVCA